MATKKFIDKKSSQTYQVVFRSLRDPALGDADAPEHVLIPMAPKLSGAEKRSQADARSRRTGGTAMTGRSHRSAARSARSMRSSRKGGDGSDQEDLLGDLDDLVYVDKKSKDYYDYSQHLRTARDDGMFIAADANPDDIMASVYEKASGLKLGFTVPEQGLPTQVFETKEEIPYEDVILSEFLSKERSGDAEIDAILHGEAGSDGEMEDDFFVKLIEAEKEAIQKEIEEGEDGEYYDDEEEEGEDEEEEEGPTPSRHHVAKHNARQARDRGDDDEEDEEEVGSISSSQMARTNPMRLIDEQFEQMLKSYDDTEIGDLEEEAEDIHGKVDVAEFDAILDEFLESQKPAIYKINNKPEEQPAAKKANEEEEEEDDGRFDDVESDEDFVDEDLTGFVKDPENSGLRLDDFVVSGKLGGKAGNRHQRPAAADAESDGGRFSDADEDEEEGEQSKPKPAKEDLPFPMPSARESAEEMMRRRAEVARQEEEEARAVIEGIKARLVLESDGSSDGEDFEYLEERSEEEHDVNTIVSTYSNLENHPALISEPRRQIKLSHTTGLPLGVLKGNNKQQSKEEQEDSDSEESSGEEDQVSTMSTNLGQGRKKDETAEEKKLRKQQAKELKKAKKSYKKALKNAFKGEELKQASVSSRNPHKATILKF